MALLIARHGETALNVARIVQPFDTALSSRGLDQADALGARLAGAFRIVSIVTSDAPRASQTATRIADRIGLPLEADPQWRERNFGVLRGQAYDGLGFDPLAMHEAPDEGESLAQFESRVAAAFDRIIGRLESLEPGQDLLLVTHGLVLRTLLERHLDGGRDALRAGPPGNASLTVVETDGDAIRLRLACCVAHLRATDASAAARTVVGI